MNSKLITQDEFMARAQDPRLVIPARFANGYFMMGEIGAQKVYATLNEDNYQLIKERTQ